MGKFETPVLLMLGGVAICALLLVWMIVATSH